MASAKIILRKTKKYGDGPYPLVLRIIKDRLPKFIYLGPYLNVEEWDNEECRVRKNHPNAARINNLILKKLSEADDLLLEASASNNFVSASQVKKKMKRSAAAISVFTVAKERYDSYIKREEYAIAGSDNSRINNLKLFVSGEELFFPDITKNFLQKFSDFLKTKTNKNGKPNSDRSIVNHLILIRTLFNKAIEEGIVDSKHYPFGKGKVKIIIPESSKVGLESAEVKNIQVIEAEEGTSKFHARNKWLFSFYFAGMRISDVIQAKWSSMIDGRFYYRMGKNKKMVSVKVPHQLKEILAYYKKDKLNEDDFIFPDLKKANLKDKKDIYRKINTATKNTNDQLKNIAKDLNSKKKLTNHIARHSFGNIAGDKISPQMLQKLYRHSDIKTTMGYQANFIHKTADEALETVLDF